MWVGLSVRSVELTGGRAFSKDQQISCAAA
jgi:hypothetical protein